MEKSLTELSGLVLIELYKESKGDKFAAIASLCTHVLFLMKNITKTKDGLDLVWKVMQEALDEHWDEIEEASDLVAKT